jgi:hypothetical protein
MCEKFHNQNINLWRPGWRVKKLEMFLPNNFWPLFSCCPIFNNYMGLAEFDKIENMLDRPHRLASGTPIMDLFA